MVGPSFFIVSQFAIYQTGQDLMLEISNSFYLLRISVVDRGPFGVE